MSFRGAPGLGGITTTTQEDGTMPTTTTSISTIGLVIIPSTDQDRSIAFYEQLGFEKRTDVPFGGDYRWVEVYPPAGTTGIALAPPREGDPVGVQTGISLRATDIEATHARMQADGVDVDPEVMRMGGPVPPMFWFRDPDANVLLIVEQPA
jgi:catechol 2,3-dioxygenase-like lactoylglutathione lyase family enzyme